MNAQTAFDLSQTTLPFAPALREDRHRSSPSNTSGLCEQECRYESPRLIRSIVAQAGLGRFVYLEGRSGKRYVFSSISAEQASLYDRAVFATINPQNGAVMLFDSSTSASPSGDTLYVHLPHDTDGESLITARSDLLVQ